MAIHQLEPHVGAIGVERRARQPLAPLGGGRAVSPRVGQMRAEGRGPPTIVPFARLHPAHAGEGHGLAAIDTADTDPIRHTPPLLADEATFATGNAALVKGAGA